MHGFRFVPPAVGATAEPGGNQALHFSGTFVGLRTEVVVVVCAPKTQSPQSIGLRLEKSLLESLFLSLLSSFSSSLPVLFRRLLSFKLILLLCYFRQDFQFNIISIDSLQLFACFHLLYLLNHKPAQSSDVTKVAFRTRRIVALRHDVD